MLGINTEWYWYFIDDMYVRIYYGILVACIYHVISRMRESNPKRPFLQHFERAAITLKR